MIRRLVPLLAVALLPALARAQQSADSTAPRPRRSWTSDRREFTVGDILTVLVDEYTLASANKGQTGSDETSRAMGLDIRPPAGPGGVSTGVAATVGSNKNASSRQSGQASRDMRFRGEMTVRVVSVTPSGVLEVKGAKTVDVDKNRQDLTLSGFVRPQDVSRNNIIESSRIADAQMLYSLKGDLGKTRGGIVGRIISVFWP